MSTGLIQQIANKVQALSIAMGPELVARFQSHFDALTGLVDVGMLETIERIKAQAPLTEKALAAALKANQPVVVVFKNAFFEDDWHDKGSMAVITGARWSESSECFKLTSNAEGFESVNFPLFAPTYYSNRHTDEKVKQGLIKESNLYTALEAEMYQPVQEHYWSVVIGGKDQTPKNSDGDIYELLAYSLIQEVGEFYPSISE